MSRHHRRQGLAEERRLRKERQDKISNTPYVPNNPTEKPTNKQQSKVKINAKKKMNITKKYSLIMKFDQFRKEVHEDFIDKHEQIMIEKFEEVVLQLKKKNKTEYTMIELGSNQAYYSLLFQAILGTDKVKNIMVEPFHAHVEIGREHFKINNFKGIFIHKSIGEDKDWRKGKNRAGAPKVESTTLEQLFIEQKLEYLDVLHCDIDGAEEVLLEEAEFLKQKKIGYIFLLAHGSETNNNVELCIEKMTKYGYELVFQSDLCAVGSDTLLLFKN